HGPQQGSDGTPGAVRPRVPQCDADRHRRVPQRLRRYSLHGRAADREHLLARWPRPARLGIGHQARLSDHVRDAVFLHASWAPDAIGRRPDLHRRRPAHRFREARGVKEPSAPRFLGMKITPLTQRRLRNFRANRRGYWSFWVFTFLFVVTLPAEFLANDRPLLVRFDGHFYLPAVNAYPETTFGGEFETEADYRDPYVVDLIDKKGWMVWPLIPYSYNTVITDL